MDMKPSFLRICMPQSMEPLLDAASGGHHHSSPDGVNGVGHKSSSDSDSPSEEEGHGHIGVVSEKQGLQGVKETEVHATVDEDTDGRDGESSVQALDPC